MQYNFQIKGLRNFIEDNSNIGDVIVMVVRGGSRIHRASEDSEIKATLRKIGLDDLEGCLVYIPTSFTCFIIPTLSI